MSLREFLDSDCGQLNPVLKVASHFTQDVALRESLSTGLGPAGAAAVAAGSSQNDQYLQDYLQRSHQEVTALPPTTFQMDSLLREIQSMDNSAAHHQPVAAPAVADYALHPNWAEEFRKDESSLRVTSAAWANDYYAAELDPIWDNSRDGFSSPMPHHQLSHPHPVALSRLENLRFQETMTMPTAKELLNDDKWADDFVGPVSTEKTALMSTAEDFLQVVSDPSIQATEFMNFVEKLSTGEIAFDGDNNKTDNNRVASDTTTTESPAVEAATTTTTTEGVETNTDSDTWSTEYHKQFPDTTNPEAWAEEYASQENHLFSGPQSGMEEEGKEDFWKKLQDEWDRLAQEESSSHPWLTETNNQMTEQPYSFTEENPFEQVSDPLSEGKKKLLEGDIPSAVLLFESAVQKIPDNPESWLLLGTTQAQNEQDPLAITALKKCLEIQPDNLTALMALAASLTNESFHLQAANALKRWLKFNPKYSSIVHEDVVPLDSKTTSILPSEELAQVQRSFMQAARVNPTTGIDPDVQSGLGILFNLGAEYDKAADCFQAALSVNPEESLLWNRLGATLANGGKSAEAIGAYRRSLEISPGFIRTRYNLGISCINLGAYKEAAEHFLSSLNIQAAGRTGEQQVSSPQRNVMSDSIWSSLRMILHLLDRSDLTPLIDSRDLQTLNKEFQITNPTT